MPITKTTVTGPILDANGVAYTNAVLRFKPSAVGRDDTANIVIAQSVIEVTPDPNTGAFSVDLAPSDAVHYSVELVQSQPSRRMAYPIGLIYVPTGGPVALEDLLPVFSPNVPTNAELLAALSAAVASAESAAGGAFADAAAISAANAAASASLSDTKATEATLASKAAGAQLFASLAAGEAATVNGDVFMVQIEPGTAVYERQAGSGVLLGWLGELLFQNLKALEDSALTGFEEGQIIRTREEGSTFKTASPSASDYDKITYGGVKLYAFADANRGFGRLANPTNTAFVESAVSPRVITSFGMKLYGFTSGKLYSKTSEADPWIEVCDSASPIHLVPMADGEVILVSGTAIYKSSGWGTAAVAFAKKVDNSGGTAVFLGYSTAGSDGVKMIVGEYATGFPNSGWENSKKAWGTQDSGETWSVIYDAEVLYPAEFDESHLHGCCYDKWQGLFFVVEGHTAQMGIRYSADPFTNPLDWTRIEKGPLGEVRSEGQPTCIVPTEQGIICTSDAAEQGLWIIKRGNVPSDMQVDYLWEWSAGRGGTLGFGQCWSIDPYSGTVYFGFQINAVPDSINPLSIFASDGVSGGVVWEGGLSTIPTVGANTIIRISVTPWGTVIGQTSAASEVGAREIVGRITRGKGSTVSDDPGGVLGGTREGLVGSHRAVAVGAGSKATGQNSVAVGMASEATDLFATAIGTRARAKYTQGVAVGAQAEMSGVGAVVLGFNAKAGAHTVAIGNNLDASALSGLTAVGNLQSISQVGVSIGHSVTLDAIRSVVVGRLSSAKAAASDAVAIGHNAHAEHAVSTVIGYGVTSTAPYQVKYGKQHVELQNPTATPVNGGAGTARLFTRTNGAGKQELCVIFPSGSIQILAAEP